MNLLATPVEKVFSMFRMMLEKDSGFFQYEGLDASEAQALSAKRADAYLNAAIAEMTLEAGGKVDFGRVGDYFKEELTEPEVFLLALRMLVIYLSGNIPPLATANVNYTGRELRVFDPSNARSTFMEMLQSVRANLAAKMDLYRSNDRDSNKLVSIVGV